MTRTAIGTHQLYSWISTCGPDHRVLETAAAGRSQVEKQVPALGLAYAYAFSSHTSAPDDDYNRLQ